MANVDITRTELVWPGKYNDDGTRKEVPRVSLPFQVIETINESQATREAKKKAQPSLFDLYEGKEGGIGVRIGVIQGSGGCRPPRPFLFSPFIFGGVRPCPP